MEKKKRKLKTQYKVAIILGMLSGLSICYWASQQNLDAGCPDCHYPYSQRYELYYNPRTVNDDVLTGVSDIFYETDLEYRKKILLRDDYLITGSSFEFAEKLPDVIFRELFEDELTGWQLSTIRYQIVMDGMEIQYIGSIEYSYQKSRVYKENDVNWHRSIEYSIYTERVDVHDYIWGSGSSSVNSYIEPEYISITEALQIANENGGKQFVKEEALDRYPLRIGRSYDEWYIHYNDGSGYPGPTYNITIDAITGEVKEIEIYDPEDN